MSERLVLRPMLPGDQAAWHATVDDEVRYWQGWDDAAIAKFDATFADMRQPQSRGGCASWFAVLGTDATLLGNFSFHQEPGHLFEVELGWHLGPAARGFGYASEGLMVMLTYGHRHLGFETIRIGTDVDNRRVTSQVDRSGAVFTEESDHILPDGRSVVSRWYAHVDPDYRRPETAPPCA